MERNGYFQFFLSDDHEWQDTEGEHYSYEGPALNLVDEGGMFSGDSLLSGGGDEFSLGRGVVRCHAVSIAHVMRYATDIFNSFSFSDYRMV